LYPSVGMKKNNEHLRVNFGSAPFVFDIDSLMEVSFSLHLDHNQADQMQNQRNRVKADINKTSADTLESARDETMLVQELVAQYLAHDGYVETARAFNREVRDERKPLHMDPNGVELFDPSQDLHAIKRQSRFLLSSYYFETILLTTRRYTFCYPRWRNRHSAKSSELIIPTCSGAGREQGRLLQASLSQVH
jgi:hypothetical protein